MIGSLSGGSSPPIHMQNSCMTPRGPTFFPGLFLWHEVCPRLGWASGLGPGSPVQADLFYSLFSNTQRWLSELLQSQQHFSQAVELHIPGQLKALWGFPKAPNLPASCLSLYKESQGNWKKEQSRDEVVTQLG